MSKIYVGKSKIAGKGLFANKKIKKGEIVFVMKGSRLKMNPRNKEKMLADEMIMGIDKDMWIRPIVPYCYINHSCNPNTGVKGKVTFIALRDIQKDEEITFDYSISEDTLWTMKCFCGEKDCRKTIRGTKFLPPPFFKKYYPIFPTYFKSIYLKQNPFFGRKKGM